MRPLGKLFMSWKKSTHRRTHKMFQVMQYLPENIKFEFPFSFD